MKQVFEDTIFDELPEYSELNDIINYLLEIGFTIVDYYLELENDLTRLHIHILDEEDELHCEELEDALLSDIEMMQIQDVVVYPEKYLPMNLETEDLLMDI